MDVVEDHLSTPPTSARRIIVAGTSGAGKTSLAAEVAQVLGLPHVEIDGLFHGPGWTRRPEFEADVERFSAEEAWVTEWQYSSVRPLLARRADTLIWLDYPRAVVMWRVSLRTVRRRYARQVLWNGNVEQPLWRIFSDDQHIIRWAWDTHHLTRQRVIDLVADGTHLTIVRLRSPSLAAGWLRRLRATTEAALSG